MSVKRMEYKLWYVYYDSFFLNINPKLNKNFIDDYFIPQAKWPVDICPNLATAFQLLQIFIKQPINWIISHCKLQQLQEVQQGINQLMLFIAMEKSYAFTFWQSDHRRIQASITHFYAFLQLFAKAIIPYPTMTIFQCKSINKLCIELVNLQKQMNLILKCINPIAKFFSNPLFEQQQKLIQNFFQNLTYFMKKLPKIKKNKINHIHNLIKFINLSNSIQIYTKNLSNHENNPKSSNTLNFYPSISQFQKKFNFTPQSRQPQQQPQPQQQQKTNKIKSTQSLPPYSPKKSLLSDSPKKSKIFKIPSKILQKAQQKQSNTTSSHRNPSTSQQKLDVFYQNRTDYSQFNLPRKQPLQRKTKTQCSLNYEHKTKSPQKKKHKVQSQKNKTSFEQQCQKIYQNENMFQPTSKSSAMRKRQLSTLVTTNHYKQKNIKQQYKKIFCQNHANFKINQGIIHKKKWALVRAYVQERINLRKLSLIVQH